MAILVCSCTNAGVEGLQRPRRWCILVHHENSSKALVMPPREKTVQTDNYQYVIIAGQAAGTRCLDTPVDSEMGRFDGTISAQTATATWDNARWPVDGAQGLSDEKD